MSEMREFDATVTLRGCPHTGERLRRRSTPKGWVWAHSDGSECTCRRRPWEPVPPKPAVVIPDDLLAEYESNREDADLAFYDSARRRAAHMNSLIERIGRSEAHARVCIEMVERLCAQVSELVRQPPAEFKPPWENAVTRAGKAQIHEMAQYILAELPNGEIRDEGAVEYAIRAMKRLAVLEAAAKKVLLQTAWTPFGDPEYLPKSAAARDALRELAQAAKETP